MVGPSGAKQELDSHQVNLSAAPSVALNEVDLNQVNLFAATLAPNESLTETSQPAFGPPGAKLKRDSNQVNLGCGPVGGA